MIDAKNIQPARTAIKIRDGASSRSE